MHYVYIYWDVDGTPRYVGIGRGDRWKSHLRASHNRHLHNKIKKLQRQGVQMHHTKVVENLTLADACAEEIRLIALYGRENVEPHGVLYNLMAGGQGGLSPAPEVNAKRSKSLMGHPVSQYVRDRVSQANKGRIPYNKGWRNRKEPVRKTEEEKRQMRQKISARMKGEGNHMFGVPCPLKGIGHSQETISRMREAKSGAGNPQYGKPRTPEQNKAHSEIMKNRGKEWRASLSPEQRATLDERARRKKLARHQKKAAAQILSDSA